MAFKVENRNAIDAERGIVVRHLLRPFLDVGPEGPLIYEYTCNDLKFEFPVMITYKDRVIVDKSGAEHVWPHAITAHIIEKKLRASINQAVNKTFSAKVSDQQYEHFKYELHAAMTLMIKPEVGVYFT